MNAKIMAQLARFAREEIETLKRDRRNARRRHDAAAVSRFEQAIAAITVRLATYAAETATAAPPPDLDWHRDWLPTHGPPRDADPIVG